MDKARDNCTLIILPRVDSTNTYAKNHFNSLNDGTVVAAVEQYAGRGRLGRKWLSGIDEALTATAVFKNIREPFHAGIIVGLAGLELLRTHLPDSFLFFKWPNDIYVDEFKIAGILSEGVLEQGRLSGVVSGIGINVNQRKDAMDSIGAPASSMQICAGRKFFLEKLRLELAEKIKKYYIIYQSHPEKVVDLWRDENRLIGENLVLHSPDGRVRQGCFTAIGENGEMILKSPDGEFFKFDCGDVKIDVSLIDFKLLSNKYKQG